MFYRNLHGGFLLTFLFLILYSGCGINDPQPRPDEQFEQIALAQTTVNRFIENGNLLYAVTEDGIYSSELVDNESPVWENEGLDGLNVTGMVVLTGGSLLAGVQRDDQQSAEPVFYTKDAFGGGWEAVETNYGGQENYTWINALERHPQQPDVIFARGSYNASRSTNGGETWQVVFGDWDFAGYQADLLEFDPRNTDRVWIGGESAIFQPYLFYSDNQGQNWEEIEIDAGGDNAVYSMAFHPDDEDRFLLGIEGEIRTTNDLGETWSESYTDDSYPYILTMTTPNGEISETVYASGTEEGAAGGNLYFLVTEDFGETWEKTSAEPVRQNMSVNDINVQDTHLETTIRLATNRGIWSYRILK
ncbi:MAG: hypothetical protein WD604_07850 [Balneolaceae bacterium]